MSAITKYNKKEKDNGTVINIESLTIDNTNFRKVLYTAENLQLVVMSLKVNESIGMESHAVDQFFRVESGSGKSIIENKEYNIKTGDAIIIKANKSHNIINTGNTLLKLYTIYSPPNHKDQIIHKTKEDAEKE